MSVLISWILLICNGSFLLNLEVGFFSGWVELGSVWMVGNLGVSLSVDPNKV